MGAHAEGELSLANNRILVVAEVVAEPEDEIRVEGRIDVEVHAEEFKFIFANLGVRIMVFEAYAQAEFLGDVKARFHREKHLVFCENLFGCRPFVLVGDGIEVAEAQVEYIVVHAWFHEEGMDTVTFVRVQAINCINAVIQNFEALGVVEFCTESVTVAASKFRAESPVQARSDGQMFVRAVQKLNAVAGECFNGAFGVFRSTDVELSFAELAVAKFHADTADGLVTGDDCVAALVTPEVVIESTGAVGQVTEYKAYVLVRFPAEFHAVEIECRVAVICAIDCCRAGKSMTDFGGLV